MKDVLEYTEDELRALSIDDLNVLHQMAEFAESLWNTRQLTEKTIMNALYGALANRWFPLLNEAIAAAITGNGRYFIRKLAMYIENKLQSVYKQEKPYVIYSDTDSCIGSTLINTDQGDIAISNLYDSLSGYIEINGQNNYIKHIETPIKAASVSKDIKLQYNNIKYVMKHKVKKKMFKIKCNGDEVTITEDHSLMVLRNGDLISVKPTEIIKFDKLIKIN